ncbi:MAG: late competence development ComFB family protein [Oscillatoriales cyanobacterium SM2_2_1]|nr:late competence development ComFB family protein [Oscillatoriales cyanobacterium SM2_2_1]
MRTCRNVVEELVIAEAEAQYNKLSADIQARVDLGEVVAFALNRLPTMYATTQRGWVQQKKRATAELSTDIARAVRVGMMNTQRDMSLRQSDPIPDHELVTPARSLAYLQSLCSRPDLKWRDAPGALQEILSDRRLLGDIGGGYMSLERKQAEHLKSYLRRRSPEIDRGASSRTLVDRAVESREFAAYLLGVKYRYSNILENLVFAITERRMQRLEPELKDQIHPEDVSAYALNRLPAMYATTRRGLKQLRQQVKAEMTGQIIAVVQEALSRVSRTPSRVLSPLPFDRFNEELDGAIAQLRQLLGREDLSWRNLQTILEEMLHPKI